MMNPFRVQRYISTTGCQGSIRHRNCCGDRMRFVNRSVMLLGWGSLGFGAWGLIDPKSLTGMMGDDPELGRLLGLRDGIVGLVLLGSAAPLGLAMRLASDLHDAIRLRERSPAAAAGAAMFALWGAAALAGSLAAERGADS
jgi:hypothetical protein